MMNKHAIRSVLRLHFSQMLAAGERYFGPLSTTPGPRKATVQQEMHLGSGVGLAACLAYAWAFGATTLLIALAGLTGYGAGAVIGLVLWSGSADLPEDRILPPAPGNDRRSG